jgi:hypothetical protein
MALVEEANLIVFAIIGLVLVLGLLPVASALSTRVED